MTTLHVILGNQLFPLTKANLNKADKIFMCEDYGLCTYEKHHKSKIALFFSAMRDYRDSLIKEGFDVIYLDTKTNFKEDYLVKLSQNIQKFNIDKIKIFEIEDKPFEAKFKTLTNNQGLTVEVIKSPMFLDDRVSFKEFIGEKKFVLQANYYKKNRKKFEILINNEKPVGGKWSFDEDNRKKLPKGYKIPELPLNDKKNNTDITNIIDEYFSDHPGEINFIYPTNYDEAILWLNTFMEVRFNDFGPYEDAIKNGEHFINHSVLSMVLNLGILTPDIVIEKLINYAENNSIPINSLEGIIRQIIGWREFIRGIYQNFNERMETENYWNHDRKLTIDWYEGTTGIDPLDDAIKGAHKYGYTHHINRLMVLSNIMNMSRIKPQEIYRWFMEMFVDSSEWVMVPNVYGMGTFADGGIFATKPYICGSSYILRMSDFKKGPWCEIVDGLYWSFIERNRKFFESNPRLSLMIRALNKMDVDRKEAIFSKAEYFIESKTNA